MNRSQLKSKLSRFRELLLSSVDEGLNVLGGSAKEAIYYYIEKNSGIRKEEIPLKPEKLSLVLTRIFGSVGAHFIEKQILNNLYRKIDIEHSINEELNFKQNIEFILEVYLGK